MRAIQVRGTGGPEVLTIADLPEPEAGPGMLVVRHTAIGLNYIDVYHRTGLYPMPLPFVPGVEGAGVVEAIGPGCEGFAVGDRVAYAGPPGGYAARRALPAALAVRVPDGVSDEVAAGAMLKGLTAQFLIRATFEVQAGQTILVHAAAGGVGSILTQWAAALGATVIGTVGSEEKAAKARAQGCAHVILYRQEEVARRVREITGGAGVPVVYDSVGKATLMASLDSLSPRGLLVSFGNASGAPDPLPLGLLSQKGSLYVTRPTLYSYVADRASLEARATDLFRVLADGTVKVEVTRTWPLAQAADAHRALEARETTGSLLLVP